MKRGHDWPMSNKAQRERKTARDKKKRWEATVSSIRSASQVDFRDGVSPNMIRALAQTADDLGLVVIGMVALEALRVHELQKEIERLGRGNEALEKQIIAERANLVKAQRVIAGMNVRYVRRGSRKARCHHPEKRR
jgi:hypothetical protein